MSSRNPIQLVVFDIDGVLTEGETKALDLELLGDLARLNRQSRLNPAFPAVTLCSGRPAQYVELMLQAIDGRLPGIYENGAGLYVPETYRFLPNPALSNAGNPIPAIRQRLQDTLVKSGEAYFQPGKEYSLTLFSSDPGDASKLYDLVVAALGDLKRDVKLVYSTLCLNILPSSIDKGEGIRFLSHWTGYALSEILGVGDSDVDKQFLSIVGYSGAPANSHPDIKSIVQYVSPFRAGEGVRDILAHFNISLP
jgi:HAD superfamily hydrolase (TIGR01484 family)